MMGVSIYPLLHLSSPLDDGCLHLSFHLSFSIYPLPHVLAGHHSNFQFARPCNKVKGGRRVREVAPPAPARLCVTPRFVAGGRRRDRSAGVGTGGPLRGPARQPSRSAEARSQGTVQQPLTGDTALRLAHFFGTSAQFWLNLQSLHDLRLAERKAGKAIKALPTLKRSKGKTALHAERHQSM